MIELANKQRRRCENNRMPPVPKGYSHWEYRGLAWYSGGVPHWICFANIHDIHIPVEGFGRASGLGDLIYWEAVKDEELPPSTTIPSYEL